MSEKITKKILELKDNNMTYNLVEELLSKSDPSKLFGKEGLFQQLKKQIVAKILESEL